MKILQGMWPVQRRVQDEGSDLLGRCESVRVRERDRFRIALTQGGQGAMLFFRELEAAVGRSDQEWVVAMPPSWNLAASTWRLDPPSDDIDPGHPQEKTPGLTEKALGPQQGQIRGQ
ncbi:unnamed protein product, partial [Choristocarpus tenellus]